VGTGYKTPPQRQIAYLYAPGFGARVAQRAEPALRARPLALLDDAGRVLAVDERAAAAGVTPGQTERQAAARCPVAELRPAARFPILEAQAALSERAARYAARWQPAGLGAIYLDATGLPGDLLMWCQELAQDVAALGHTPAIGLTSGKFGAGVAARVAVAARAAVPAQALILDHAAQRGFLARQTASLLPLDADAALQLRHLGIRTLGQYARLPTAAVLTRWGEAGRTAQRWARGDDDRPVISPDEQPHATARIEFDGVLTDRAILLAALLRQANALLEPVRRQLQAVSRLELLVTRGDRRAVAASHVFPAPTALTNTVRLALGALLERLAWDGEGAADATLTLAAITDAPAPQLTLFDTPSPRETLALTLDGLAARYGRDAFRMAVLSEPDHPLPERRASWQEFR
jgi:protein ImuB